MAQALRTPTITPDFVGGNNFINTNSPASNISSNLMPNGRLKGSLTYGMEKVADGLDAIYRVQAQATAKEMDNRFSQAAQNTLFDPDNGYYNKKGKAAVDGYKSAVETLKADFQQGKNGVEDPFIQRMYDQSTGARLQTMLNQAQQHYAEGVFSWNVSESKARIANLGNTAITAVNSWNDDKGVYMQYHNGVAGEVNDMAEMYGIDKNSEQYKNLMTESMTTFHSGALDFFLSKDSVGSASGYLKKFRSEMDAATAAKYEEKIHDLADRLEAKRERLAAKQAAMQGNPAVVLAAINAEYAKKRQALEDKRNQMKPDEYTKAVNKLDTDYNRLAQGVKEGADLLKATQDGDALRYKKTLVEDRLNNNAQAIYEGRVKNPDDIFSTEELQKLNEYHLMDYVKSRISLRDPNLSKKALQAAKSVPDPASSTGRALINEQKRRMTPEDSQACDNYYYKKISGKKTPFDDKLVNYALSIAGVKDGKIPKLGSPAYTKYINIAVDLKNRVASLASNIPKTNLTEDNLIDCLNQAYFEQTPQYLDKGTLWDSNELVPRDEDTGRLLSVPDSFVTYKKQDGTTIQLPYDFVEKYAPEITADMINGNNLNTGMDFRDNLADLLAAKYKDLQNQNTAMTNAIIDK